MKRKTLLTFIIATMCIFAIGTINVLAATTVNVSTISELQSAHNYTNSMDKTWIYTHPTAADSLEITFSSSTATENNYDYIYILDGKGTQIGKYTGTALAGKTITVTGNVVKIRLTSDSSTTKYGFSVTNIKAIVSTPTNVASGTYGNNVKWTLDNTGLLKITGTGEMENLYSLYEIPWYSHFKSITKVEVGEGITNIPTRAFWGCKNLTDVILSKDIAVIDVRAFSECSALTSIELPENLSGLYDMAFRDCTNLKSIIIPDNVKTLGTCVFYGCTNLTSATIGNGVEKLYSNIFDGCTNLKTVTIGEGVTEFPYGSVFYNCPALQEINWNAIAVSDFVIDNKNFYNAGQNGPGINVKFGDKVEKIPAYAFYSYSDLSSAPKIVSVTIGKNVKTIGNYAFYGCSLIENINWNAKNVEDFQSYEDIFHLVGNDTNGVDVTFSEKVESIPAHLFNPYSSGTPNIVSVTLGQSTKRIGKFAFYNLTKLTQITLPDSLTDIGEFAFARCSGLTAITIPQNVTNLGQKCFSKCTSLTRATIKNGVTTIGLGMFSECSKLTELILPNTIKTIEGLALGSCINLSNVNLNNGLETIEINAFYGCSKLQSITLPSSVKKVEDKAFSTCTSLKEIVVDNSNEYFLSVDGVLFDINKTRLICYPPSKSGTSYSVPNSVTTIAGYAFGNCTNLTQINIPNSVVIIGESAFRDCTSLTSATIPSNLESLGSYAFYGCTGLEEIIWNAKKISDFTSNNYIFLNAGLNGNGIKVVFGNEVEKIPAYIFYPSTSSSVPKITEVTIGDAVTSIGTYAFGYSTNLTELIIPDSVTTISSYAFYNCTNLSNLELGEGLKTIGSNTFSYCKAIKNLIIPNGITKIDNWAFSSCSNLSEITLPNSLTNIGNYAFYYCNKLSTVNYNGIESQWNNITIGSNNTTLTDATKNYFWYVSYIDENNNIIKVDNVMIDAVIPPANLNFKDGYISKLYRDQHFETEFDASTPITNNTTLYVYFVELDALSYQLEKLTSGYKFEVTLNKNKIKQFETAILIAALYNGDTFITLSTIPVSATDTNIPLTVETTSFVSDAKLMLWTDFETLVPLCEASKLKIE